MEVFYLSFDLCVLTLVGVVLNFSSEYLQISYQVTVLTFELFKTYDYVPLPFKSGVSVGAFEPFQVTEHT